MTARKMLWIGAIGTAIAALCCFTPILALLFAALGATALFAWTDLVLLPLLVLFLVITVAAALKLRGAR